jgi:Bacterial sugar transferase
MGFIVAVVLLVLAVVGGIIRTVFARLLGDEIKSWLPCIVERLLRRAVASLPKDQRERFQEEWHSHLDEIPGEIGKLVVALGFPFAARRMSRILGGTGKYYSLKRLKNRFLDLCFSTTLLVLFLPLTTLVSLAVWIETGGPVLFRQECVGLAGKKFYRLKFRTMRTNLTRAAGSQAATELDNRITRVGLFLRENHLDELPQLINVLRGEMTLVGPRPRTYLKHPQRA